MKKYVFVVSCALIATPLLAVLPANLAQLQLQKPPVSSVHEAPAKLGQNLAARWGAWASLALSSVLGMYLTYTTGIQLVDNALQHLPLVQGHHPETASALSLLATVPISTLGLIKAGPVAWYFFYMLYAGERMSPVLARNALRDIQVYVQHLHVIKAIQQDLFEIIDQINQAATVTVSGDNVQFSEVMPDPLQKQLHRGAVAAVVDPLILMQLQHAIEHDEAYVHEILQQLKPFLSDQELLEFEQALQIKSAAVVYAIAYELQDQAQAIIEVLKMSQGQDMGDDALILNHLIKDLVAYWQKYTQSLADGIDASVRFCNNVHLVEQMIVNWLDRSLLCV